MSTTLVLNLLGKPTAILDGKPLIDLGTNKTQALLYYLAVTDEVHPREHLARLLWGGDSDDKARNSLRVALAALRKNLPNHLDVQRQTIAFEVNCVLELDVHQFDDYSASIGGTSGATEVTTLKKAIDLYRGDFLEDFHVDGAPNFEDWLLAEREYRRQVAIDILNGLATAFRERRQYKDAQEVLSRLLELEPWEEDAHYMLMETLSRLGDFNGALAQYQSCVEILAQELDAEPMPETIVLYERIQIARSLRRHNLPAESTPFVGRESELTALYEMLISPECQLITITGLGGMGKTRAALASAKKIVDREDLIFLNGIIYSSLASTLSAELLPSILAEGLAIKLDSSDDPLNRVIHYLANQECLLILDGFETLLSESQSKQATDTIIQILTHCPSVKFLITSREPLNIRQEQRVELQGLTFPLTADEGQLETYSAIQLFLQGAEQVRPGFQIQDDEKDDVVALCKLLGGMPLGLKLSAAWLRGMSVQRIVAEINRNLDFLSTRMRDVAPRQRSLRAVFNYTWSLLTNREKDAFRSFSAFQGEFGEEAAFVITGVNKTTLNSLIAHSLMQCRTRQWITTRDGANVTTEVTRYSMHQMVRQFAAEKLQEVPEQEKMIRSAHCQYYVTFLKEQTARFSSFDETAALSAIGREDENLRAAWQWAIHSFNPSALENLLKGISLFFQLNGPFQEAEARCRVVIEQIHEYVESGQIREDEASPILGKLMVEQARFLIHMSRNESALQIVDSLLALNEMLKISEAGNMARLESASKLEAEAYALQSQALIFIGDLDHSYIAAQKALQLSVKTQLLQVELVSHRMVGFYHLQRNEYELSHAAYEEALEIARKLNDRRSESTMLSSLGVISVQQSDYQQATIFYEQALNLSVEIGDRPGEVHRLNNLGRAYSEQRDFVRAEAHLRHAYHLSREIGYKMVESNTLLSWARNNMYTGNYAQASDYLERSLQIKRVINDRHGEGEVLTYMGLLHQLQGKHREALDLSRQGLAIAKESNSAFVVHFAQTNMGHALSSLGQLTSAATSYRLSLDGRQALGHLNLSMEPRAGFVEIGIQQTDVESTQSHLSILTEHVKNGSLDGTDQPFRIYWIGYQALLQSNPPEAERFIQQAKERLNSYAEQISDTKMRQSFLENVSYHRLITQA
ncbi:MAG: tetratricopeptide repeat protein [Chloroflexota bacterium]